MEISREITVRKLANLKPHPKNPRSHPDTLIKKLVASIETYGFTSSVGRSLYGLNGAAMDKALAKPWTTDKQTFSDRIWSNKLKLINSVNTHVTQMIIRGESPRTVIDALAKDMDVSKRQAGRLVMTESAAFATMAQHDCFEELGAERYVFVATFSEATCPVCGAMDGQVFKQSEFEMGVTAPLLHPNCRCATAPYFEDMEGLGERWARDPNTGEGVTVPRDMTYDEWREKFVVDKPQNSEYNATHSAEEAARKAAEANAAPVMTVDMNPADRVPDAVRTERIPMKLTESEHNAIVNYIGGGSYTFNAHLREGELTENDKVWAYDLNSALAKMPTYQGDVQRSVSFFNDEALGIFLHEHEVGNIVVYKAFSSFSAGMPHNPDAQVQLLVASNRGKDIRSINPAEHEVLYPTGSAFSVIGIDHDDKTILVYLEEM